MSASSGAGAGKGTNRLPKSKGHLCGSYSPPPGGILAYVVHCEDTDTDILVFARSRGHAKLLAFTRGTGWAEFWLSLSVSREPRADRFATVTRAVDGGAYLDQYMLRSLGWTSDDDDETCSRCGLTPWPGVTESFLICFTPESPPVCISCSVLQEDKETSSPAAQELS